MFLVIRFNEGNIASLSDCICLFHFFRFSINQQDLQRFYNAAALSKWVAFGEQQKTADFLAALQESFLCRVAYLGLEREKTFTGSCLLLSQVQ